MSKEIKVTRNEARRMARTISHTGVGSTMSAMMSIVGVGKPFLELAAEAFSDQTPAHLHMGPAILDTTHLNKERFEGSPVLITEAEYLEVLGWCYTCEYLGEDPEAKEYIEGGTFTNYHLSQDKEPFKTFKTEKEAKDYTDLFKSKSKSSKVRSGYCQEEDDDGNTVYVTAVWKEL